MRACMYVCMYVCVYSCLRLTAICASCLGAPVGVSLGCLGSGLWSLPGVTGVCLSCALVAMATDRTMTSPWNKMAGRQLRLLLQVTWVLCMAVSACGLPRQGSLAATILSGRPAQPIGLLPRSSTERCPVHMLCAGLHPDAPGQVRLTGLPTLRLYTAWRIHWAHHLSGSMLPSRLHPLLASGACSCSDTTTQSLLWTVSARFKLQPLAKYMYSLERQSTTFLPPLSMTPANPYDFPQKSLKLRSTRQGSAHSSSALSQARGASHRFGHHGLTLVSMPFVPACLASGRCCIGERGGILQTFSVGRHGSTPGCIR